MITLITEMKKNIFLKIELSLVDTKNTFICAASSMRLLRMNIIKILIYIKIIV